MLVLAMRPDNRPVALSGRSYPRVPSDGRARRLAIRPVRQWWDSGLDDLKCANVTA